MTHRQRGFSTRSRPRRRADRRRHANRLVLKTLPLAVALCFASLVWAADPPPPINPGTHAGLPQYGGVKAGTINFDPAADLTPNSLTIHQTSQRAVIDWRSFDIGAGKTVHFNQLNASAAVLNRVTGSANMSEIYGTLSATGTVLLMNPNGVYFHQGSHVNVGSLIVTTGTVNEAAFWNGGLNPEGTSFGITDAVSGSITNEGSISAANNGLVALVAPSVVNKGAILATGGRIALSGADRATVSLNGGLFELAVPAGAQGTNATLSNLAGAQLEGKTILMTTGDAANLLSGVINLEGVQQASSAIVVDGHTVVLKSDLNAPSIAGNSNTIQVHDTASIQDAVKIAKTGSVGAGAMVELQEGTFNQQVELNKANMTLRGAQSGDGEQLAKIVAPNSGTPAIDVKANNVSVQGLEIEGPLTVPYSSLTTDQWNATPTSVGIRVNQNVTGFNIADNKIHNVRTGIRVFGTGYVGSISNNEFDNTKGGILFQYTNGNGVTMSGNREGSVGNEWGIGFNINSANANTGEASAEWQASLLALANSNNQMAVEDRKYATSNRTRVIVDDDSTAVASDDFNYGNGLGNARQPLKTIQSGINAVVKGGTVKVREGVYTLTSTLNVNKSVTLDGAGESQTIIDGRSIAGNYGLYVTASDVTLSDFTLYGPSNDVGTAYGIKVSPGGSADARLSNFTIRNVTSRGAGRAELDLNGVDGALIESVTLNGAPVGNDAGSTAGAGLQLTDSANITVRNTTTLNNNWGGLAIYQANRSYNQLVNNITIEANNSFNEANPVYMQDESTLLDFGSLSIAGFDYAVRNAGSTDSSQYTWLQRTKQNAYDYAVNVPTASSSYIQGWNGAVATQTFEVGVGNLIAGGQQAMLIGTAIAQASSGATVNVGAGTYAGFRVNKAGLTVLGDRGSLTKAGAGVNASVINSCTAWGGGVCSTVLIDAENVTVSGFDISNANGPYGVQIGLSSPGAVRPNGATLSYNRIHGVYGVNSGDGIRAVAVEPADSVTIKYNLIEDISPTNAAAASSGKSVAGIFLRSAGGAFSQALIEDNLLRNISISAATGINGAKGIWVGGSAGSASVAGLTIRRNQISGVQSNVGAEGILVNHGKNSTGTTSDLLISGNTISDVVGVASSHGIELSGPTPNAQVSENDVNLATSAAANTAGVYIDTSANANPAVSGIKVSGNSLTGTGYGVDVAGNATVNASGNWWGSNSESAVAARTRGSVDFSPFLMSGTDTDLNTAGFQGGLSNLAVTALGAQTGSKSRLEEGIDLVNTGGTVNVGAGTFVQASKLEIKKAMTLRGAGQASTTIDARGVTAGTGSYGMSVTASDVTLQDFTFYGPSAYYGSAYGIKVSPEGVANFPLRNFTIRNVTSRGAGKAELDLNGVDGALIDGVTLNGAPVGNDSGVTEGAGLQLTDSANITVRNTTTRNNNWGGLAIYQANKSYNQRVNNITIEANNSFHEANPVYMQDESTLHDFGSLSIAGFDYAVRNAGSTDSSQYTWLQRTQQNAYDYAVNLPTAGSSYIQDWNGSAATQSFRVGIGHLAGGGNQAMTIATAIAQASSSGATINVGAGTYVQQFTLNKANLTLKGETGAKLEVPDLSVVNGVDAITITANNVTVEGMEIAGPINAPYYDYYATSKPNVSRGIVVGSSVTGFAIRNNDIHDVRTGILINGIGNTGSVQNNRIENTKSGISVQYTGGAGVNIASNREGDVGNEWGLNLNLNKYSSSTEHLKEDAPTLEWQQHLLDLSAANESWKVQDQAYKSANRTHVTVAKTGAASNQGSRLTPINTIEGGVNAVVAGGKVNVNAGTYAESVTVDRLMNLSFNDVTLRSLSLTSGAAGSGIGGKLTATGAGGLVFDGSLKLLTDTTLETEGRKIELRGAVQNNGSTAYGLTLATNAGNGNNRGDVTLHSGGADGNALGQLSVTAKNFTLDNTLWVRGYTVDAKGDVALSNNTLKATAAGVTSTLAAGGNVTGSTTSAGAVVLNGDGNVSANVTANGAATVTGRNVSGAIRGSSVTATAQQVLDAAVTTGGAATLNGREIRGSASATTLTARADTTMNLALDVTSANLYAGGRADLSGRAGSVVVDAKSSYFNGSFPAVDDKGTGVPAFINGVPKRDEKKTPSVIVRPPVIVLPPLPPPPPPVAPAPVLSHVSVGLPTLPVTAAGAPAGSAPGPAPAPAAGSPGGTTGGSGAASPAASGGAGGTGSSSGSGSSGSSGNGGTSSSTSGGNGTASSGGTGEGGGSSGTGSSSGGGGTGASGGGGSSQVAAAAPRPVTVTRNAPGKAAGESLDRGQGVEVDLSPGR